uniref:Uncharacterized protein n=1 Tax=Ditylenchus dipsaci TaxID=166011 RepID=A0A915DQA6_9BILA
MRHASEKEALEMQKKANDAQNLEAIERARKAAEAVQRAFPKIEQEYNKYEVMEVAAKEGDENRGDNMMDSDTPTTTYLRKQKKALVSTEIIVLVISFFINVYAYLEELPIPETTICLHFACTVVKTGSKVYVITKIFGGGITILAGFIFLAILFNSFNQSAASAANQSGKKQRANQIAGLMVCTEIAFNFLPQVGVLLLLQTTGIIIAPYVGPYNVLLNSFDVAIAALMYSTTLKKFTKRDSTLVDNIAPKSKYSQFSVHDKQLAENVTDMMFNEICELNDIEQEIVEEENFEIDLHAVSEATEDEISDFEATSSRQKPIPSPLTLQNNNLSNPNKEIEPEDPSSRSLSSAANKPVNRACLATLLLMELLAVLCR